MDAGWRWKDTEAESLGHGEREMQPLTKEERQAREGLFAVPLTPDARTAIAPPSPDQYLPRVVGIYLVIALIIIWPFILVTKVAAPLMIAAVLGLAVVILAAQWWTNRISRARLASSTFSRYVGPFTITEREVKSTNVNSQSTAFGTTNIDRYNYALHIEASAIAHDPVLLKVTSLIPAERYQKMVGDHWGTVDWLGDLFLGAWDEHGHLLYRHDRYTSFIEGDDTKVRQSPA